MDKKKNKISKKKKFYKLSGISKLSKKTKKYLYNIFIKKKNTTNYSTKILKNNSSSIPKSKLTHKASSFNNIIEMMIMKEKNKSKEKENGNVNVKPFIDKWRKKQNKTEELKKQEELKRKTRTGTNNVNVLPNSISQTSVLPHNVSQNNVSQNNVSQNSVSSNNSSSLSNENNKSILPSTRVLHLQNYNNNETNV